MIELILYFFVILTHDLIEVLTTFIALYVLSRLDEVFSLELSDTELALRITRDEKFAPLRRIKTTTSHLGAHGKADHRQFFRDDEKAANWSTKTRKTLVEFYQQNLINNSDKEKAKRMLDAFNEPIKPSIHLKVLYHERSCSNKCLFKIFRVLRFLHVSVWFYSAPFLAIGA